MTELDGATWTTTRPRGLRADVAPWATLPIDPQLLAQIQRLVSDTNCRVASLQLAVHQLSEAVYTLEAVAVQVNELHYRLVGAGSDIL